MTIQTFFRGEIVNTPDLVKGLKSKKIFGAALDVFEGEKAFIFKDMHEQGFKVCSHIVCQQRLYFPLEISFVSQDFPHLHELTAMDNVIISSHVAFYTDESLRQITEKTLSNYEGFVGKEVLDEANFVA